MAFGLFVTVLHLVLVYTIGEPVGALVLLRGVLANFILGWGLDFGIRKAQSKGLQYGLYGLVAIILAFAHAHVEINGSYPDIANVHLATDPGFIRSVLFDQAIAGRVMVYFLLSMGFCYLKGLRVYLPTIPGKAQAGLVSVGVILIVALGTCSVCEAYRWQAASVLDYNLFNSQADFAGDFPIIDGRTLLAQEVLGESLVETSGGNVILLMVEGVSQLHLDNGYMPELVTLQSDSYGVEHFINHQRQTNRGLYSILCGAYPNLVNAQAKSDLMALGGFPQQCLPHTLAANGYETIFMQAAPLGYMSKDLFAQQAGFEQVYGDSYIKNTAMRGEWGVDDRSFYQGVLDFLEERANTGADADPFFLGLLTSGTHPPYGTPESTGDRRKAFEYASSSIDWFVSELSSQGLLENTTIIITSDESSASNLEEVSVLDADNSGVLLVLGENIPSWKNPGVFGQVDLALSILDLTAVPTTGFGGRSIFRSYSQPRRLYAGNTFRRTLYAYEGEDMLLCSRSFDCQMYPDYLNNPEVGQGQRIEVESNELALEFLELISNNDIDDQILPNYLVNMPERSYSGGSNYQLLGRYISTIPVGDELNISIKIDNSVSGSAADDLQLIWLGFDCTELDPSVIRAAWNISAREGDFYLDFNLPQFHAEDCHKAVVLTRDGEPSTDWDLRELKITRASGALPESISRPALPPSVSRIAHAGGSFDGVTYTNSYQALENSYAAGYRLFELDFLWTADTELVCSHDWGDEFFKLFNTRLEQIPTLAEFNRITTENSELDVCHLDDLADWLKAHPDAKVVTDIKTNNLEGLQKIIVEHTDVREQFVPQIYHPSEYSVVRQLGFEELILTLYRYTASEGTILQWADRMELFAITMPEDRAQSGLGLKIQAKGIPTYVHTINDQSLADNYQLNYGISEIYTDDLIPVDN